MKISWIYISVKKIVKTDEESTTARPSSFYWSWKFSVHEYNYISGILIKIDVEKWNKFFWHIMFHSNILSVLYEYREHAPNTCGIARTSFIKSCS